MFSIDQNCHSLWDSLPKLQALAAGGHHVRHLIEDIDVAYTSLGADSAAEVRLARERHHPGGGADWGAAMFYSEFLGKLPVDPADWQPYTGLKPAVLARQLGRTVEDLYDEFSPSDNWQLIGPSYIGDRDHHRVMGDLTVAETGEFLRQLMDKAREDMQRAFPSAESRGRLSEWFERESVRLTGWLAANAAGKLVDVYRDWLAEYLGGSVELGLTGEHFSCRADELLRAFLTDYDLAAGLYNEAVAATDTKLRPLKASDGELPYFAALDYRGHAARTGVFLRDGQLVVGELSFPLVGGDLPAEDMAAAGVRCLAGKAILLILQVRLGPAGQPLALPYRGSAYAPASNLLAEKFRAHGLLTGTFAPIMRVRFGLLDAMKSLDTPIRLPDHLAAAFGAVETTAGQFARTWRDLAAEAGRRLESFRTPDGREQWQRLAHPQLPDELDRLESERRQLARGKPDPARIRPLSHRVRAIRAELLGHLLEQIARDVHVRDVDYWDSRGALLPWSVALGGETFYNELIAGARIYAEPAPGTDDG